MASLLQTFVNYSRKRFYRIGTYSVKLFTAVMFTLSQIARVFAASIHFHPSLKFVDKAGVYHSKAPLHLNVRLQTLPINNRLGWTEENNNITKLFSLYLKAGKPYWRGRLGIFDLLIKVACFVTTGK